VHPAAKSIRNRHSTRLVQQCVDRELLQELGMKDSSQYVFCCDVIHNLKKYKEVSFYSSSFFSVSTNYLSVPT
jgi:hypothetical protein